VDVTGITLPVTKHNYLVQKAEDIAPVMREAFALARSGRPGPVLVDITSDAQKNMTEIDWDKVPVPTRQLRHQPPKPSAEVIDKAMELLKAAKRPLILAGRGIQLSGARQEVIDFAEKANIPITTTLLAIGTIPSNHPLNLGMMGMHGEAWTNQAIQEADLLLAFGMRFDDRVTGDLATYALSAKKIHIEIDKSEIHKNVHVDVPILGDLREALVAMLAKLDKQDHSDWVSHVNSLRTNVNEEAILEDHGGLHAPQVIHDLWKYTNGAAVVVTDVGQHQMWEAQYYKHNEDRSLITSGGLGTMGFALPAAMGAKMACPEKEVWSIAGDGGFQMNMQEMMTLVQEGIKINMVVINNGYLGMVRQWQELFYQRRYAATPMISPDFVKLAEAFGIPGRRVTQRSDVEAAVKEARESEGSFLLEFVVDQEFNVMPMVPAGGKLDQMIRR
jgi:acetolactate synthase-1/2/3 large subunit